MQQWASTDRAAGGARRAFFSIEGSNIQMSTFEDLFGALKSEAENIDDATSALQIIADGMVKGTVGHQAVKFVNYGINTSIGRIMELAAEIEAMIPAEIVKLSDYR
jgi:hypothetical protein